MEKTQEEIFAGFRREKKERQKAGELRYYKENREKIRERQKIYNLENREKARERTREYIKNNKEQVKQQRNQKHNCPCGGKYTNNHKAKHMRSKKHKQLTEEELLYYLQNQ